MVILISPRSGKVKRVGPEEAVIAKPVGKKQKIKILWQTAWSFVKPTRWEGTTNFGPTRLTLPDREDIKYGARELLA